MPFLIFDHHALTPPPADVTPMMIATRIIASITAYSTAVVASSARRNFLTAEMALMEIDPGGNFGKVCHLNRRSNLELSPGIQGL